MSNFIKTIGDKQFYCLDDYFGKHQYGYIEMNNQEKQALKEGYNPWLSFVNTGRKVYNDTEFSKIINY